MNTKKPWKKPELKVIDSFEHVQTRIRCLQRRLAILYNNQRDEPSDQTRESIEIYSDELNRLQDKYSLILKLKHYAGAGL